MSFENDPNGISRRKFLKASAAAIGGLTLAACGQTGGGGAAGGQAGGEAGGAAGGQAAGGGAAGGTASLKWASWGNPGEAQRFQEYTKDWNQRNPNIQAQFIPMPTDYEAKLLTQLAGGTAPDMFYAGDGTIGKLIANKTIIELTDLLKGPNSKSKPEDFFDGLWGAARTPDGKIYGVAVDCNPMVMWHNRKLLQEAGVSQMPADMAKAGQWSWQQFQTVLDQLVAKGKRGMILDNWWGPLYSWVTTNGGKVYDGENFVGHEDPKSAEAFQFIFDNVQGKKFTYAGSLPKGQGADAMFMSQQVGFVTAGRWYLPVFKQNKALDYDVVTWPTTTGKKIEPAGVPTAYAVINAKTPSKDAAFALLTDFVSKDGQIFRLKGGGNAVPSVKGADEVVSEGNNPTNWQAFLDAREVGYALWPAQASVPGLNTDIEKLTDELWLKGGDVNATLKKVADAVAKKKGQA